MSEVKLARANCRFCGYLCGLIATVEDGRVTAIEPDPSRYPYDVSIQRGCRRWRTNLEFLEHPDRINYPLKRVGERGSGQWQRVSWDEALDDIADRLRVLKADYGAETLATCIGGAASGVYTWLYGPFRELGHPEYVWYTLAGHVLLGVVAIYLFTRLVGEFHERKE